MGVVLGLPVSGTPLPGLLHVQMTGLEAWTGGGFGPEASAALQPFIFAAAAFYLSKVVVERKLTPPPWRARPAESSQVEKTPTPDRRTGV
jgi:hypothetical protein